MTSDEFSERIIAMMQVLYRVSYAQLPQSCDREEAVQECLCRAWQKRHQLKDERYMQTWVVRILINECHNIQKKGKRELPIEELPVHTAPPEANLALHDALLKLDEKLRLPIVLHYLEDFHVHEIAKILRVPQGTVKTRMMRGRRELKKLLSEEAEKICRIEMI